jgi:mRNA-degrading endonuclease RelE of RelBE toxin-antitoxin system
MIKTKIESASIEGYPHLHLTRTLKGFCKLKVGQFRVIYSVDEKEKILHVHKIGHRQTIYSQ